MTTLMDTIREDWKKARLDGRMREATTLSTFIGECQTSERRTNPARLLGNDEVIQIARKFLKDVNENLRLLADKPDMDAKRDAAAAERDIFLRYLPTMLDETQLEAFVRLQMANGAGNVGAIMKALSEKHAGAYDGRTASTVASRCLKG